MELKDATELIDHTFINAGEKQVWADLGCGNGTFTLALATLLGFGSIIYAIDSNKTSLGKIPPVYNETGIKTVHADFVTSPFPFGKIDGVLMANSLHYVKDKHAFMHKLKNHLRDDHQILIVEYDTDKPVKTWVPYPVSFNSLKQLFSEVGYTSITRLHQRPSVYGSVMYAALVSTSWVKG